MDFNNKGETEMKYFSSNLELIREELKIFGFWTWANIITAFRLGMTILATAFILVGIQPTIAFLLLTAACALDGADGWVARKYNCQTILGGLFDKLTDKVIIGALTTIILLLLTGYLTPKFGRTIVQVSTEWLIYLLLAETVLFLLGGLSLWFPIIPSKAGSMGKTKMIVECVFHFFCYFTYLRPFGFGFDNLDQVAKVGNLLLEISFWLAIGSTLQYSIRSLKNYRFAEK